MSWQPVAKTVWQGRDDSAEASNAKRIFSDHTPAVAIYPGFIRDCADRLCL